jgi:NTP pyrophosphatase (non-canonical NTP hydrolase)
MTLRDCQKQVDEWIQQYKMGYWKQQEILARLMEETGEVAREINHLHGPKKKKASEENKDLGVEMADIIFTLCCMANSKGIDLDQSFKQVMDKCYGRDKDRFEKKI